MDNLFSFDQDQITRLLAMAEQRYTAEPEARRGAAIYARAEVEGSATQS